MKHLTSLLLTAAVAACAPPDTNIGPDPAMPAKTEPVSFVATGWPAKTLPEISAGLAAGEISSEALTEAYIARIEAIDRDGPALQAVLALNPDALEAARASDARRADGVSLGPLDGVPILVKDNIETKDPVATTAGALALKDNVTGRDAPLIASLRGQGAIILGKSNLSQWANFRSENSMSGWSALGGQVRNPHMLDRNPCGSSSGSGAGTAASLAAGSIGTETNGSIICPSNINGVVGFKPTVGLVSQQYIVPISSTQDTAGPMTKTVKGAAMMLTGMATGDAKTDYTGALDTNALDGKRIGVLRFAEGSNADIKSLFNVAIKDMEAAGATLVEIDNFDNTAESYGANSYAILKYEFKATLNDYLADAAPAVKTRSLSDVIAFNAANADIELALFDQSILVASDALGDLSDQAYQDALNDVLPAVRANGIDKLLADNDLDVLVSPSGPLAPRVDPVNGDVWPDWAGAGWMAAVAGYPHLTVPMGQVHGLPSGISFMAGKDQDAAVLSIGYAYEQRTQQRADPQYLSNAEDRSEIKAAMTRK
jgi:amidase